MQAICSKSHTHTHISTWHTSTKRKRKTASATAAATTKHTHGNSDGGGHTRTHARMNEWPYVVAAAAAAHVRLGIEIESIELIAQREENDYTIRWERESDANVCIDEIFSNIIITHGQRCNYFMSIVNTDLSPSSWSWSSQSSKSSLFTFSTFDLMRTDRNCKREKQSHSRCVFSCEHTHTDGSGASRYAMSIQMECKCVH